MEGEWKVNRVVKGLAGILLFFSLLVGSLTDLVTETAHAASSFRAYVSASKAKVLTGPGVRYHSIGTLYKNNLVTVVGRKGNWIEISFGRNIRYIWTGDVRRGYPFQPFGAYVYANTFDLRKGPDTSNSRVTTMLKNDLVTVLGKAKSWYKIQYGKVIGYTSPGSIRRGNPPRFQVFSAYVYDPIYGVRRGPSTKYNQLTTMSKNGQLMVLGNNGSWYKVKYGKTTGYAWSGSIRRINTYQPLARRSSGIKPYQAYVIANALNVRSAPTSTQNNVITIIKKNMQVTVLAEYGTWLKINYSEGKQGYVSAAYLLKGSAPKVSGSPNSPTQPPMSNTSEQGLDISHYQSISDFRLIKKSGYQFVILKATQGQSYVDGTFYTNLGKAQSAGLITYAYHFFEADSTSTAAKEANHFISVLNKAHFSKNNYVFVDVEDQLGAPLTKNSNALTSYVYTFLNIMRNNGFNRFGIYSSYYFYYNRLNAAQLPSTAKIWIANYRINNTYNGPGLPADIWQYTSSGRASGIQGSVDVDISYFTN
jgi:Lyzozyme M1 (1,4-beta-N-acetylmuramidase)